MGMDLKNQISYMPKVPTANEAPKISGKKSGELAVNNPSGSNSVSDISGTNNAAVVQKATSAYELRKNRMAIEADLDKLVKQMMPDLGVRFKIHDSGQVITSVINNDTEEVVREFPAEKILDLVHSMVSKLGIVVNKKM